MQNTNEKESWEIEFDNLYNSAGFDHLGSCGCMFDCECVNPKLKMFNFIRSTLSNQHSEIVEKIVEKYKSDEEVVSIDLCELLDLINSKNNK